ncbi:MAG: hypothetical protein ACJ8DC_09580 [Gemmatimonadales bacterium]
MTHWTHPDAGMLPYEFDTSGVVKVILRGVLGLLLLVVVPGILYSLIFSHSRVAAVQLLLIGAVTTYFGLLFLRNLGSSRGVVTTDAVTVEPGRVWGIRLSGPAGRFPIQQFEAVRVERIAAPTMVQGRRHERVSLVGRAGAPDILLARTALDAGRALGAELATALQLPYQEQIAPY